jgi:hypothetical protein
MRARLLRQFRPGQPCARCGAPMLDASDVHLDHTDDRRGYLGLSHAACNTTAPHRRRPPAPVLDPVPSQWPARELDLCTDDKVTCRYGGAGKPHPPGRCW